MKTKKPAKSKKRKSTTPKAKKPPKRNGNGAISKRNLAAIAWLDRRMKEGPSDEDGPWEEFKQALELNRLGERRLFRD